jgi:tetratricopeptide (TPR) repeat protein
MPDNGEYIAEYLSGGLSPEEMKAFEARLATDEELNREYQLLSKGMEYLKARVMLEEIEKDPDLPALDKEYEAYFRKKGTPSSKRKFRKAVWRTLQAAAFIGALLVIRAILFSVTAVKLYDKFYVPLTQEVIGTPAGTDSTNSSVQAGIECYLLEDYVGAIKHLVSVPEGSFYLGLSQLELGQFDSARESLQSYQDTYPEDPEANWYLGLTYLRLDDLDEALIILNRLSSTDNPYRDRAEELIGKIERVKAARVFDN